MQEIIEKEGITYEFASGQDFATNEILFKLIRETEVGGHVIKRECAKAELVWYDASEKPTWFLTVPKYRSVENDKRKETCIGYWLTKAFRALRKEDKTHGKID
ncbi:MAG TPA: hypothetical protein ENI23_16445 [bacterium]|nr:hypothetical protein [bacterium]